MLKKAEAGIEQIPEGPSGALFDELAEILLRDYRINGKKSLVRAEISMRHLHEEFQGVKVREITTARIDEYIEGRMRCGCKECGKPFFAAAACPFCGSGNVQRGARNATINRELAALKRMMNLGAGQTPPLVDRIPRINMLKENNTRTGFFEHEEFLRLREHLPEHLRPVATFGYKSG